MSESGKRKAPVEEASSSIAANGGAYDDDNNNNNDYNELKTSEPETGLQKDTHNNDDDNNDNSNNNNERPSNRSKRVKNPRKKQKKKDTGKNLTRKPWNQYENGESSSLSATDKGCLTEEPHAGSYANPEMQKLFGVELPQQFLDGSNTGAEENSAATIPTNQTQQQQQQQQPKRSKKKVAFLLGYLGTNYSGFQINPAQRTLQATFELALLQCHLLDIRNFGFPNKYAWSTSGRTDKGVHAVAQVCSAKIEMLPDHQTVDDVRRLLNQVLPDDIRVLDVVRTTRNFCAKTQRDRVRYQYMIPSFLLANVSTIRNIFEKRKAPSNGRHPTDPLSSTELKQLQDDFRDYRVTPSQLQSLKTALHMYEGTHSFHNFTKGVSPNEARATRYIVSFHVEDPIIFDNGTEWIPTQVLGQSFLLHQIRKMICMAIEVVRGAASMETIELAMSKDNNSSTIQVGLAPAHGLYLEMSYYAGYNRRKQTNAELHDIEWEREDLPAHARWKEFRNGSVMKHVVDEEEKEGNFVKFLFLQEYFYDRDRAYDPTKEMLHNQWRLLDSEESAIGDDGEP